MITPQAFPSKLQPGRRGFALVLVLIATAIATIACVAVLKSLTPTTAMANNSRRGTDANALAMGGIDSVQTYLDASGINWPDADSVVKTEGWWFNDSTMGDGTFSIYVERMDGDPNDDAESFQPGDRLKVTSVGKVDGFSAIHTRILKAVYTEPDTFRILFLTEADADPDPTSEAGKTVAYLEAQGCEIEFLYTGATIWDFQVAAERNDVAFIPEESYDTYLNGKLLETTIGVVIEDFRNYDELAVADSGVTDSGTTIEIVDDAHSVTTGLGLGNIEITTGSSSIAKSNGGLSDDTKWLAEVGGAPTLMYLEPGDLDSSGNETAGRRITLPWGTNYHAFNDLTFRSQIILRRSLEWAAGKSMPVPEPPLVSYNVLFVSTGSGAPSLSTASGKTAAYIESLGHTVEYIIASDSQANYDAAVSRNEAVYIPEDVVSSDVGTKLKDAAIGVITEEPYLTDDFEISNPPQHYNGTAIVVTDNSHTITDGYALGSLTIFNATNEMHRSDGGFSSDTKSLAETPTGYPVLLYFEAGDTDRDGGNVAGRRLVMPWGWTNHDFDKLNADGLTILQRSLEWAAQATEAPTYGLSTKWFNLDSGLDELADVDWSDVDDTSTEDQINWPSTGSPWRTGIQQDHFAVELTGNITVPTTGTWTFYLDSDDGSELVLDGSTLINNDYLHGMVEVSASTSMTAGQAVPLRVRFFENGGGAGLILSWSGPGTPKQVVPASAFGEEESSTGPIAHWTLDETSGSTASDSAGSHNGTLHNGVSSYSSGVVGNAMNFDGNNDHIAVAHNDDLLLDAGTVAFWFRPDDTNGHQALFSKDTSYYATGGHLHIYLNGSQLRVRIQDTGTSYNIQSSSGSISANTWYHAAFTFGPDGAQLYLNGSLVDTDSYTGGLGTSSGGAGNYEPLVIGAGTWQSNQGSKDPVNNYFNGKMDEVYIYGSQLDASAINALANP